MGAAAAVADSEVVVQVVLFSVLEVRIGECGQREVSMENIIGFKD